VEGGGRWQTKHRERFGTARPSGRVRVETSWAGRRRNGRPRLACAHRRRVSPRSLRGPWRPEPQNPTASVVGAVNHLGGSQAIEGGAGSDTTAPEERDNPPGPLLSGPPSSPSGGQARPRHLRLDRSLVQPAPVAQLLPDALSRRLRSRARGMIITTTNPSGGAGEGHSLSKFFGAFPFTGMG